MAPDSTTHRNARGAQGGLRRAAGHWSGNTGTTDANASGQLVVHSNNAWFESTAGTPIDLSGRTQLTFDLVSTTGTGPALVFKEGAAWEGCPVSTVPWVSSGPSTVTFDLTGMSGTCLANVNDIKSVEIWFNTGDSVIDNVIAH